MNAGLILLIPSKTLLVIAKFIQLADFSHYPSSNMGCYTHHTSSGMCVGFGYSPHP